MTTTLTSTKYKGIKNSEIKYMDAFRTYFFLVIGAFLMIIPLIWMLFSALKTPAQFLTTQLSLAMPENPQWKNFTQRVWEMNPKLQLGIELNHHFLFNDYCWFICFVTGSLCIF